jgi:hypothetical protein
MRILAGVVLCLSVTPSLASAHPGIVGYSGRPTNGTSDTCLVCHTGEGTPPVLTISVPEAITAGATGEVRLVVEGTSTRTSMNASFSDGVHATAGEHTQVPIPLDAPNEVGAALPLVNGAVGTYTFGFVAPDDNGPVTLWIAAMAASGSGTGGDGVATATRTIMVTGGKDAPPASSSAAPPPPTHAIDPFGGGSEAADAPVTPPATAGAAPTTGDGRGPSAPAHIAAGPESAASCATSHRTTSDAASRDQVWFAFAFALALASALRARACRGRCRCPPRS